MKKLLSILLFVATMIGVAFLAVHSLNYYNNFKKKAMVLPFGEGSYICRIDIIKAFDNGSDKYIVSHNNDLISIIDSIKIDNDSLSVDTIRTIVANNSKGEFNAEETFDTLDSLNEVLNFLEKESHPCYVVTNDTTIYAKSDSLKLRPFFYGKKTCPDTLLKNDSTIKRIFYSCKTIKDSTHWIGEAHKNDMLVKCGIAENFDEINELHNLQVDYITTIKPYDDTINLYAIRENTDDPVGTILPFVVSLLAFLVSLCSLWQTSAVENNTKTSSIDQQVDLLLDFLRHIYRNFVVICTFFLKMMNKGGGKSKSYRYYPSEEHLHKLKIPLDRLQFNSFYSNPSQLSEMDKLYLNFRNFNLTVDTVAAHLSNPCISKADKNRDIELLCYEMGDMSAKIFRLLNTLLKSKCLQFKALYGNKCTLFGKKKALARSILNRYQTRMIFVDNLRLKYPNTDVSYLKEMTASVIREGLPQNPLYTEEIEEQLRLENASSDNNGWVKHALILIVNNLNEDFKKTFEELYLYTFKCWINYLKTYADENTRRSIDELKTNVLEDICLEYGVTPGTNIERIKIIEFSDCEKRRTPEKDEENKNEE